MGLRFLDGTKYRRFVNREPDKMEALFTNVVASPEAEAFLAEDDNGVAGMIVLTLSRSAFDSIVTAQELFWWMEPSRRAGVTSKRLLRAAEAWAREKQAGRFLMIAPDPGVGNFLEKLGYDYVESVYQLPL